MRVEYFFDREDALRTAGTRIVLKCSLAASQPSVVLGSRRRSFTVGSVEGTGRLFVVSWDAACAIVGEFELKFVVATADAVAVEFKFPHSDALRDATEFELAVEKMIFIDLGGGVASSSGRVWTSRQVALTRKCVSSRRKHR